MRRSRPSSWRCPPRSTSALAAFSLCLGLWLSAAFARTQLAPDGVLSGSVDDDEPDVEKKSSALAARFDAALRKIATGTERAAAAELSQLAHEAPQSELAPESLFQAGLLYEEHLFEPEAARACYREVVQTYPHSRLLRRAKQRLSQLDTALKSGAAPLVAFQTILRTTTESSPERQQRLGELLQKAPDFALADHVLFLLADTALRGNDRATAMQRLDELYRRFATSDWAAQGHRLQADLLLSERRIDEARLHYRALASYPGTLFPLLSAEGLAACARAARLWRIAIALWIALGLIAGLWLFRGARHLWPPPDEALYYIPIAGLLGVAALLVRGGTVASPIWQFGLLGATLTWLAAAAAQRLPTAARRWPGTVTYGLFFGLLLRIFAACAVCYLIIYHHGLLEVIAETLRNGPDTD